MEISKELHLGLLNLHDAFLNASLQRDCMLKSALIHNSNDPNLLLMSDRGRFERTWVSFLYVLLESWNSKQMEKIREYISSIVDVTELIDILNKGENEGYILQMKEVRHYMCHRDNRKYWDDGRTALIGNLEYHDKLHLAFSKVLLNAFNKTYEINMPSMAE